MSDMSEFFDGSGSDNRGPLAHRLKKDTTVGISGGLGIDAIGSMNQRDAEIMGLNLGVSPKYVNAPQVADTPSSGDNWMNSQYFRDLARGTSGIPPDHDIDALHQQQDKMTARHPTKYFRALPRC